MRWAVDAPCSKRKSGLGLPEQSGSVDIPEFDHASASCSCRCVLDDEVNTGSITQEFWFVQADRDQLFQLGRRAAVRVKIMVPVDMEVSVRYKEHSI